MLARSRASRLVALSLGCQADWMSGCWLLRSDVWASWALVSIIQGLSGEAHPKGRRLDCWDLTLIMVKEGGYRAQ